MGGGKEQRKTNQMIDQASSSAGAEHREDSQNVSAAQQQAASQAGGSLGQANSDLDRIRNANYNVTPDYGESKGLYRNFAATGGIDADAMRVANPLWNQQINDPTITNRMRGGGVYDEFAQTGGLNAKDLSNIRNQSAAANTASYSNLRDMVGRQQAVQGGYAPGASYLAAQMGRDQAANASANVRDTELGITSQRNQGRMWGAEGMTGSEGAYQGMRANAGGNLMGTEANIQDMAQRGKMFGTSGLFGAAESEAGYANNNANRNFARDQSVFGGSSGLYGTQSGLAQNYMGMGLNERQGYYDVMGNLINNRSQNNPRSNWWEPVLGAGATVGAAALSSRHLKEDIQELSIDEIREKLKNLKIYTWKYKGDSITHMGPMAQEFKEVLGIGDGETLHLVDVMGVMLAMAKVYAEESK